MSGKSLKVRIATRLRKNKVWADIMDATGRDLVDKRWIFIVGCYNSGTTLLHQILSQHPEISGIMEEGVMLTDSLPRPEDFGWRRMWHMCENEMRVVEGEEPQKARRIKRQWSHFVSKQKSIILEKSISNSPRMLFFEHQFQPSFFIHIVRNGYAVAKGIRRKAMIMKDNPLASKDRYPIGLCAKQWQRSIEVVREVSPNLKNFIEITYEELTEDPDNCLREICGFLNIGPFPQSLKEKSFTVHGLTQYIINQNGKSLDNLSSGDIAIINSFARQELINYNYFAPPK